MSLIQNRSTAQVLTDNVTTIVDDGDSTKAIAFQASGITSGQTRTLTVQDVSGTMVVTGGTDVAVADGGTGASTAENARINLNAVGVLSTTTGIDGKVAATTNLYTVPTGKTAVLTGCYVRITTATNVTVAPTAGIGVAGGEDDIFGSSATGLDAADEVFSFLNDSQTKKVATTTQVIKLGIDVGATADVCTLAVDLVGYLL